MNDANEQDKSTSHGLIRILNILSCGLTELQEYYRYTAAIQLAFELLDEKAIIQALGNRPEHFSEQWMMELSEVARAHSDTNRKGILQGLVFMYANIEAIVSDLIRSFLPYEDISKIKVLDKCSVPIKEFVYRTSDEVYDLVYKEYVKSITKDTMYGYKRFEALLEPIGIRISDLLEKNDKDAILELAQIRNLILHKFGRADRQIVSRLQHKNFIIGEDLNLTEREYSLYFGSCYRFLEAIIHAVHKKIDHWFTEVKDT